MTAGGHAQFQPTRAPVASTGRGRWLLTLLAAFVACVGPFAAAATAKGPQVAVKYPVSGLLSSKPPHHHAGPTSVQGDFSLDATGSPREAVYARFANANGELALRAAGTFDPCRPARANTGGRGLLVNVYLNGVQVGFVAYSHMVAIPVTSGAIANGAKIGELYTRAIDPTDKEPCWAGEHVHVELKSLDRASCFVRPLRTAVDGDTFLGVIGGRYASSPDRTCPAGVEWFAGSIVRWRNDPAPQPASWIVGKDLKRRWVPDIRTYSCLVARGTNDGGGLVASVLDALPDLNGIWAQCPYGDVNYDGRVNVFDLSVLLSAYGRTKPDDADVNYDSAVNIYDLSILLTNYGRTS